MDSYDREFEFGKRVIQRTAFDTLLRLTLAEAAGGHSLGLLLDSVRHTAEAAYDMLREPDAWRKFVAENDVPDWWGDKDSYRDKLNETLMEWCSIPLPEAPEAVVFRGGDRDPELDGMEDPRPIIASRLYLARKRFLDAPFQMGGRDTDRDGRYMDPVMARTHCVGQDAVGAMIVFIEGPRD